MSAADIYKLSKINELKRFTPSLRHKPVQYVQNVR
jgi:hypothetical protein